MLDQFTSENPILAAVAKAPGALGGFVRSYPGTYKSLSDDWLENWFSHRIEAHFDEAEDDFDQVLPLNGLDIELSPVGSIPEVQLTSVHPHYFRGFRDLTRPIAFNAKLVVVDGPNSSGKTSLGESMEWLLSGGLSRREGRDHGSPRELENCVANQFRPSGETTWVSATFTTSAEPSMTTVTLRRELVHDYGSTGTSRCESRMFINDRLLTEDEELSELDRLFGSVPPLLMQHTLRYFVESPPDSRRQYFEKLLQLDELTDLIMKSVIGNTRLRQFRLSQSGAVLQRWRELASHAHGQPVNRTLRRSSTRSVEEIKKSVVDALIETAHLTFGSQDGPANDFEPIRHRLKEEQRRIRHQSFPPLSSLQPQIQLSQGQAQPDYIAPTAQALSDFKDAWHNYSRVQAAIAHGGINRAVIAQAFTQLVAAGEIDTAAEEQLCPLCSYSHAKSLTKSRIDELQRWIPLFATEQKAKRALERSASSLSNILRSPIEGYHALLPSLPDRPELNEHLAEARAELVSAVDRLATIRNAASDNFDSQVEVLSTLATNPLDIVRNDQDLQDFTDECLRTVRCFQDLHDHALTYATAFQEVERAVGLAARQDPQYRVRETWLTCAGNLSNIVAGLKYEDSKLRAQRDLELIRDQLIDIRRNFLESRRSAFSEGIRSVWSALRGDTYSFFSELNIPEPRGRGFPVEIEVKAQLDDGSDVRRVDALQVFSESQVNALGIAAFITRSELIGHQVLFFDDPVQSMDEEHFKTFARDVLGYLLAKGFQVVLLTHNDTFARDVSYWHYDRLDYVTMAVRHSRRQGCIVDEGNRRVSERLEHAEKRCDEGLFDDAWKPIRLAIERLYLVSYLKHCTRQFEPVSWAHQSAEHMWNDGAGDVIERMVPGSGQRLKEIIDLSAAGSHDASVRGETELRSSIRFLRSLLNPLRIGNG